MPVRERVARRGALRGRRIVDDLVREVEATRLERGLSRAAIGRAIGISGVHVGRLLGPDAPRLTIVRAAELLAVCGLDLWARAYPGGSPIRDAAHVKLLARLRTRAAASLSWRLEVPVIEATEGGALDQRAWDVVVTGNGWSLGVEAETRLADLQALKRRLSLKQRDSRMDIVVLLVSDTRHNRAALRLDPGFRESFPCSTRRSLMALKAGACPGGSAIILL